MKYFIHTYGCQMNVHDSEKIGGILSSMGYEESSDVENADVIVFNTCCIRETAEQKILGNLGQLKQLKAKNRNLIIAVVGCMTQQSGVPESIRKSYPFVDIILGTSNLTLLKGAIENIRNKKKYTNTEFVSQCEEDFDMVRTSYPNAWVNINYGCNNFCTYCIVPYVRGRERSRSEADIMREVRKLLAEGYKEITLLGQNVNSYGKDTGTSFAHLLEEIGKLDGKFRLRFMTSHPKDLSDDVIDVIAKYKNICNCIHLPVQSGSTSILQKMNRHYTRDYYLELINKIRDRIPNVGITTDIIVGFPGETDEDFESTLDLVRKVKYSTAFCFVYSRRKGTPAYSMDNQIPFAVKKSRITRLIATQNENTVARSNEMQGNVFEILVEDTNDKFQNTYCGRTECGRLVNFKSDKNLIGEFVNVRVVRSTTATLWGELV